MRRTMLALVALLLPLSAAAQNKPADKPVEKKTEYGFAVYKLGEAFATDDKAGESIDSLCKWLGKQVEGAEFARRGVRNKPEDALKLLKDSDRPVALAIVSPGFYFKHKDALKLTVLAEARRGGSDGEQYVLLADGAAAAEYPEAAIVATSLTADPDWLNKAVLPAPQGKKAIVWKQADNLFDAAYDMVDQAPCAAKYVLVDRVSLKAFGDNSDLKGLKQGLKSETLPQDLVVEVDGRLGDKRDAVKKALAAMDATDEGKKLGENLQSPNFPAPDEARLARVAKLYE